MRKIGWQQRIAQSEGRMHVAVALLLWLPFSAAWSQDLVNLGTGKPIGPETTLMHPVGAEITIEPDGSVSSFAPDPSTMQSLQGLLIENSKQWRFKVPVWQGQPARIQANVLATVRLIRKADGTYGALLDGVEWKAVQPPGGPKFPRAWLKRGHNGGTFAYSVVQKTDSSLAPGDLLLAGSDQGKDAFDAAAREYIGTWRRKPLRVNGEPVQCSIIEYVTFMRNGGPWLLPAYEVKLEAVDPCPVVRLDNRFRQKML